MSTTTISEKEFRNTLSDLFSDDNSWQRNENISRFAGRIGVSPATVKRYLNGKTCCATALRPVILSEAHAFFA